MTKAWIRVGCLLLASGLTAGAVRAEVRFGGDGSDGLLRIDPFEPPTRAVSRQTEGPGILAGLADDTENWRFMPVLDDSYQAQFTMAIMLGKLGGGDFADERDNTNGFELAYNSPFIQPKFGGRVRQQISHVTYNHEGRKLTSLEFNPRWFFPLRPGLEVGAGVGIGMIELNGSTTGTRGETITGTERAFSWQVGLDVAYRAEDFHISLGVRRQFVRDMDLLGARYSPDNTRIMLKLGFWL